MAENYQFRSDVNVKGRVTSTSQGILIGTGSDSPSEGDTAIRDGKVMVYEDGAWKEAETRFGTLQEDVDVVNAKADGIAQDVGALSLRVTENANDITDLETRLEAGLAFNEAQQEVLNSGITEEKVQTYDGYQAVIDAKQDKLNTSQSNAVNSGITASKVSTYDGYAATIAGKQDALTSSQKDAVDSGITSAKVSTYDGYATTIAGKQDKLSATSPITITGNVVSCPTATSSFAGLMSAADKSRLDALTSSSGGDGGASSAEVAALKADISALQTTTASLETELGNKLGKTETAVAATKATQDGNGRNIVSTYATKTEVSNAGYITKAVEDLTNYYLKTETYTKEEVNNLITPHFTITKITSDLPSSGESNKLYLKASTSPTSQNVWDEYLWVDDAWEKIGSTETVGEVEIDTSSFATKAELSSYALKSSLKTVATSGKYSDLTGTPTIPAAANDATLTITQNGTSKGTFSANASANKTIAITVPTKVSELTNDSNYVTTSAQTTALAGYASKDEVYTQTEVDSKFALKTSLSSYLTTSAASSTYLTQTNAASTYLPTATASSTYLTKTSAASTYRTVADSYTQAQVDTKVEACQKKCITVSSASIACTTSDSTYSDFPYRGAYTNSEVTASDTAIVTFQVADATSGNLAPVCETYAGGVYIYSKTSQTVTGVGILIVKG